MVRAVVTLMLTVAFPAHAQYEVADIPFFDTPKGTAALGGRRLVPLQALRPVTWWLLGTTCIDT
jgi:hypothetical protein